GQRARGAPLAVLSPPAAAGALVRPPRPRSLGPTAFGRRRSTEPLTPSLPDGLDLVGAPERDHPEIEDGERPQRQAGKRVVTGWERSETEAPHEAFDKGAVSRNAPEGQVGDQGLLSGSVERLELEAPVDLVDRHVVVARVRGLHLPPGALELVAVVRAPNPLGVAVHVLTPLRERPGRSGSVGDEEAAMNVADWSEHAGVLRVGLLVAGLYPFLALPISGETKKIRHLVVPGEDRVAVSVDQHLDAIVRHQLEHSGLDRLRAAAGSGWNQRRDRQPRIAGHSFPVEGHRQVEAVRE